MADEYSSFIANSRRSEPTQSEVLPLIEACKKQAIELSSTLNMLRGRAWAQLQDAYREIAQDEEGLDFAQLDRTLVRLHLAAVSTASTVEAWPTRRGGIADTRPTAVAKVAAAQYYRVTRRVPSRTVEGKSTRGLFVEFLSAIFAALGITASVDAHAREAAHWWKTHDPLELIHEKGPKSSE